MQLSSVQEDVVTRLMSNVTTGLTTDEACDRREQQGYNVVKPPVDCPAWICCLLPCIKSMPSMKFFAQIKPEDAEIRRNGKWIRYDASSLVTGDIIRLEEGDLVPADCTLLSIETPEMLVDQRAITGEGKPQSSRRVGEGHQCEPALDLFWGATVVQGSGIAIVTAIGNQTLVAKLIADKRFPPTENVLLSRSKTNDTTTTVEEEGISLISPREHNPV